MIKESIEKELQNFAKTLSPNEGEREFIQDIYKSVKDVLGENNCLQIGSYPRYTAIRPLHDLDVLFVLGEWNDDVPDPSEALEDLIKTLEGEYTNPTEFKFEISKQSHSVSIKFIHLKKEVFAVDILPAYIFSENEFGQDMYRVPEVIQIKSIAQRELFYKQLEESTEGMKWIKTDPRGYIKIASDVDNDSGGIFRKSVKLVKLWANNLSDIEEGLKLKSFHLEQAITKHFQENSNLFIVEAIFRLFTNIPNLISEPYKFPDRANPERYIDEYISDFARGQKERITAARDGFLRKLEYISHDTDVEDLFEIEIYFRKLDEEFLFDSSIMTFIDPDLIFKVDGFVKPLNGFSSGWLRTTPSLKKGLTRGVNSREIEFSVKQNNTSADDIYWKVRNSDNCKEPRGEITIGRTKYDPERTQYKGQHFVEGYAIKEDICIARSRVYVNII